MCSSSQLIAVVLAPPECLDLVWMLAGQKGKFHMNYLLISGYTPNPGESGYWRMNKWMWDHGYFDEPYCNIA